LAYANRESSRFIDLKKIKIRRWAQNADKREGSTGQGVSSRMMLANFKRTTKERSGLGWMAIKEAAINLRG
jgi:hypothetical protein